MTLTEFEIIFYTVIGLSVVISMIHALIDPEDNTDKPCSRCKGTGKIYREHWITGEPEEVECPECSDQNEKDEK